MADGDVRRLRELAKRLAELAEGERAGEKIDLWEKVNRLERGRPPLYCFVTPQGWTEIVPEASLRCREKWARAAELELLKRIHHAEHFHDDTVIDADWPSRMVIRELGWGIRKKATRADHRFGARRFEPVIVEERDIEKIGTRRVEVDHEASARNLARDREVFGDILNVFPQGRIREQMALMDEFIQWRGIEQTFMDMMTRPAWIHEAMERMARGLRERLDRLEREGALSTNHRNQRVGSGGWGWTEELPKEGFDGKQVRPADMWGHATTQIFSQISPDMHDEFAITYEKPFLERFGLSNYGCCEPLHRKVGILRKIKGLRRLSMSPWIDVATAAENTGADYVFSYKPNPATIAADAWRPENARRELRDVLDKTRDCVVEFVLKDVETVANEPHRLDEWTRLAREEIDRGA